jgi:hypothetical protein
MGHATAPAEVDVPPDRDSRLSFLEAELSATRAELESTKQLVKEMADGLDDDAAAALLARTEERIQDLHAESRLRVESIIRDAESLRALAVEQAEHATEFARAQLERKSRDMMADAETLKATAQEEAERIVEEANAYKTDVQSSIDSILDKAEAILRTADEKFAEADAKLAEAQRLAGEG